MAKMLSNFVLILCKNGGFALRVRVFFRKKRMEIKGIKGIERIKSFNSVDSIGTLGPLTHLTHLTHLTS